MALLTVRPMGGKALALLRSELSPDRPPSDLIQAASRLLANMTAQAGLVTVPRRNRAALRQVEFLPLADGRVLVILVLNEREVQNRVIYTDHHYSQAELTRAANMINQRFGGRSLDAVHESILEAIRADRATIDSQIQASLELASKALQPPADSGPDYVVAGETRLVDYSSHEELDKLRRLFDALQQKKDILELVDRCRHAEQVLIGEEAGFKALGDFSVVTAPYGVAGQALGVLGVIGPTRMAYERIIPTVNITARMLGTALSLR